MHVFILIIFLLIGGIIGFINAISGGGGIISTPLFLAFGLSPYTALATSKLVPIGGLITGSIKYYKSHLIDKNKTLLLFASFVTIGAIVAANITLETNAIVLKYIILFSSVFVLILITFKKNTMKTTANASHPLSGNNIKIIFWLFIISIYQGSIGIGGGVFLAFMLRYFKNYSYLKGAALMNTLSIIITFTSATTFAFHGTINFEYGFPMFLGNTIGGYIGAHTAINKGDKFIKIITVIISLIIILKVLLG